MSTALSLDVEPVTVVRCAGPNRSIEYELTTSDGQVRARDQDMARAATHVLRDAISRGVVNVHQVCGELLDAHVRLLNREERARGGS